MEVDNSSLLDRIARDTPAENDEPQASTSAVTLDNGLDTVKPQSVQLPRRPWGLADYGIPPPPSDILPDPAVEVCCWSFDYQSPGATLIFCYAGQITALPYTTRPRGILQ